MDQNAIFNDVSEGKEVVEIDLTTAEIALLSVLLKTEVLFETLETIEETVDYGQRYAGANISKGMKQTLTINDNYERYFVINTTLYGLMLPESPKKITKVLANFLLFLVRDVSGTLELSGVIKTTLAALGPTILAKLEAVGAEFARPELGDDTLQAMFKSPVGLA